MKDEPKTDAPTGGDQYKRLIAAAQKATRIKVAVANPCDDVSLSGAIEAHKLGLIDPILVGPPERIRHAARDIGLDISPFELVASAHSHDSAAKAVGLVTAVRVEALMKGSLHTDELMSAVVAREGGIRTERRISHCFVMDVPRHSEPLIVTDAAVNIIPDLEAKADIIRNAIDLAHAMGGPEVRVAILSSGSERAFIFRIKLVRCTLTVDSVMPILWAICLFRRPIVTWIMISRSRELSVSKRSLRAPKALSLSRRARSRARPASTASMRS